MTEQIDGKTILKQYLFGTADVPTNFNLRIRPADAPDTDITLNGAATLQDGHGRYAWLSRSNLVEAFFSTPQTIGEGVYSIADIANTIDFPLNPNTDLLLPINNYTTDPSGLDHAARSFIFGLAEARLASARFVVGGTGERWIEDAVIEMGEDQFDFKSSNDTSQTISEYVGAPTFDPYELGRGVNINYTGTLTLFSEGNPYTNSMFNADQLSEPSNSSWFAAAAITGNIASFWSYKEYLQSDPILAYYEVGYFGQPKDVIYIDSRAENQDFISIINNTIVVGNENSNTFKIGATRGVEIYASFGNDNVYLTVAGGHYVDGFDGYDSVNYTLLLETLYSRGDGLYVMIGADGTFFVLEKSGFGATDVLENVEYLGV
ncbi:hypothetical protein [Defluviimonas salinarum]|uniref:Uncharacterized protein n=1 Tax=Defluviimonas salinarum TaxID=2992147 RepID=A0ABT3J9K9_9RHOB|nr:hypothetical protein [Defluviimonas salinarum]MCW3784379.1 hypothetical protein [Defluviimonas salinarum]